MGSGMVARPASERFWERVNKTESCWIWMCKSSRYSYGRFYTGTSKTYLVKAHRYSWELHKGKVPDGLFVLHKCDVPLCVNPDHLFLGTHQDNMDDMARKGRRFLTNGDKNGMVKLTKEQVIEIRAAKDSMTTRMMATKYGVSEGCIRAILTRRKWKWLSEADSNHSEREKRGS